MYCTANLESVLDIYFSFTRLEVIRVKAFNCKMDKLSEPSPVPFFYVQNSTISCRAGQWACDSTAATTWPLFSGHKVVGYCIITKTLIFFKLFLVAFSRCHVVVVTLLLSRCRCREAKKLSCSQSSDNMHNVLYYFVFYTIDAQMFFKSVF